MTKLKSTVRHYGKAALKESECPPDPYTLFSRWFDEALKHEPFEPNAMTLATVNPQGHPTARIVLLKDATTEGFTFYTNYKSSKAKDLTHSNHAACVFWWPVSERQVRLEGAVTQVSKAISDDYFQSRSRDSQIAAHASAQSQIISSRTELDEKFKVLKDTYAAQDHIPRPEYWGGYILKPTKIEFWQGGPHRLHDRICYEKQNGVWGIYRLAP